MKRFLTKFGYPLAILLAITYAVFTLRGPQGVPGLLLKRADIRELEKRNADLAREVELKRERINRLRESRAEQDLEIRKHLKLVGPGEKVFILRDQETRPSGDQ